MFDDGAGPRCVGDWQHDERWAGQAGERVGWFDITGQDERSRALGIDPRRASTELHVLDEHRQIRSEPDACIRLGADSLVATAGLARRLVLDPAGAGAALSLERPAAAAPERAVGMTRWPAGDSNTREVPASGS